MNVSKSTLSVVTLAFSSLALAFTMTGCSDPSTGDPGAGGAHPAGPPPVDVVTVEVKALRWEQSYPGRAEGLRQVTIRPRVGGIIVDRAYEEGATVEEGQTLFQIDPATYDVALKQAQAELQRAEASLRQTERDWVRAQSLFASDALSERQRDDAQSAFELAQAGVAVAQSTVEEAQLQRDYSNVRSPFSGVTSTERMPVGSLVNAGDALTTLTQLDPIFVMLSLPEGDPAFKKVMAAGSEEEFTLQLRHRDNRPFGPTGTINFRETAVDQETGTVRVRATFPNPDHVLLPGQFVRVFFENMTLDDAAIIPANAVLATPMGNMVYVLGADNTVQVRPVVLGPNLEDGQLVTEGLAQGDRVVASSLIRIQPGMEVTPVEKTMETEQTAPESEDISTQDAPEASPAQD